MRNVDVSKNRIKEISKLHQKKYRDETGLFIAEGRKALDEMINSNVEIVEIYSLKELDNINLPYFTVKEDVMKKIASTDSVCEVLTVAKKRYETVENLKKMNKIALLDSVSDPGNLGTIIRSAAAFGVEGIILYGNCTDLYSAKVIRACAGNFFKIPSIHINSIEELQTNFTKHLKIATALSKINNISIKECRQIEKFIIMLGSEAKGLNSDLIKIADKNIRLNMKNGVESLNLAVCASILFYEIMGC